MKSKRVVAVGLLYNDHVRRVLDRAPTAVDHLSIVPDVLQVDHVRHGRRSARGRFADVEIVADVVLELARDFPMVGHGVGLSIGSPRALDRGYVNRMRSWVERLRLLWYSEHLSFFRLRRGSTAAHDAGLACPLPCDRAVQVAVARRAAAVQAALGVPFLLENGVSYVAPVDDDMCEPEFLNGLCAGANTGLLLDLHNLYVNSRNLGVDAAAALEALDAATVREIHIAGGDDLLGYYTDAHSGSTPEPVWALLRRVLPRLEQLQAITFEYHQSVGERIGVEGVLEQLARAREELAGAGIGSGAPQRVETSHVA